MKKRNYIIIGIILLIVILIGSIFLFRKKEEYLISINGTQLEEKVNNKEDFIFVVSRTGCSHCAEYLPIFENILEDHNLKAYVIDLAKLNTKEKKYFNETFNITSTPTTVFIKNGEETTVLNRIVGSVDRKTVENKLKENKYIK